MDFLKTVRLLKKELGTVLDALVTLHTNGNTEAWEGVLHLSDHALPQLVYFAKIYRGHKWETSGLKEHSKTILGRLAGTEGFPDTTLQQIVEEASTEAHPEESTQEDLDTMEKLNRIKQEKYDEKKGQ